MKSAATYAGDPRRQATKIVALRQRVETLRKEAREDYARAEAAEMELVKARAEIEWLKKGTASCSLTEYAAALRRRSMA